MVTQISTEIMIEGREVEKVFKDFWGRTKACALAGVDISVPKGTVFGLLGPNGAGKSTLIKIILGHLYCTNGQMRVLGKNPRDVAVKQYIGYLPERTSFYTNLTAMETLLFFGRLLGLSNYEVRQRGEQLICMVGLENAVNRLVGEFSHGMRKRLGLAQALLNDPDLLLLDEPTAGLDPIGCHEIKELILTLGERGKTILMTSHLLGDVQDVCDTIMILFGGKVQAKGVISELLAKTDELLVRSPMVSSEAVETIKSYLLKELSESDITVANPTRTLEEFFISVVADASSQNTTTSGAGLSKGIADYLKSGITKNHDKQPITTTSLSRSSPGSAVTAPISEKPGTVEKTQETAVAAKSIEQDVKVQVADKPVGDREAEMSQKSLDISRKATVNAEQTVDELIVADDIVNFDKLVFSDNDMVDDSSKPEKPEIDFATLDALTRKQ